jgi:APA family basic amino acid/polyamine antiporter
LLRAAGFLFFAFAGYARIATLGEEVVDPARVIPRAIRTALGAALAVYAVVAVSALAAVGPGTLAGSEAPLVAAVEAGDLALLAPAVRFGAAVASLGVLLSLLSGLSRTIFAMAANGDLPRRLAAVHPRYRVPHRAELAIGAVVALTAVAADIRGAIGFSAFAVLCYYALTNASAWTLGRDGTRARTLSRLRAGLGVAGCLTLALALPIASVAAGTGVVAAGVLARAILAARRPGAR